MKPASAYVRMLLAALGLSSVAFAGQGVQRLLYTTPNATFVSQPTGEVLVTVNDTSGSIATLQTEINNARSANPSNVIVINLASLTYTVSTSSLTLGSNMCLVATGATIKASSSSVTVPLITISSGSTFVSVGGGVLDANGANIQGIYAPAASRVNIDKVVVKNCGQDCILLKGQGLTTYDNEMTVTRCDVSGSAAHAGISIQNSTQSYVGDNVCHNSQDGIYLSAAWGIVANNVCSNNTNGIEVAGGNDNVIANNTCNNNAVGIKAGATGGMIVSNSLGNNSTAGISSIGTSNNYLDNLFTAGNAANFSSGGTTDNIIAYKAALSASGQTYFYPPLIDNQHTNTTIVNGMGRTDLTIGSTSIDSVQSQYNSARSANPNNVIVLHLNGTYTVGASPLTLSSDTCVLLGGTIQINSSTTATKAISIGASQCISISGGTIDGGNLTGHQGINATGGSMIQVDSVTLQNFGDYSTSNPGSDAVQILNCPTPNEVTRCVVNKSGSRGLWQANYSTHGKVLYAGNTVHFTRAGLDCDSGSYAIVALFNEFSSNTYGLWCEQSAQHNLGLGNVANTCARTEFDIGNLDHTPGTDYNSYICNTTAGGSRAITNGAGSTSSTETSHNFLFDNVVVAGSITSNQYGVENYYSQNYLASGGNFTTSGAETIFNSVGVDGATYFVGVGSGLPVLVQGASTSSGAAVVLGPVSGLGNDQWDLIPTGDGYYTLSNVHSGLVVAIQGASTSAGAPAIQAAYGSAQNDQWMVMSAGNGTYYLVNRLSGLCLDVPAGGVGTQLDQQPYSGGTNQTFTLNLNPPPPVVVADPSFSPGTGTYGSAQSVTITTTTGGASIRYTTDGSTPSETAGTLYSGPVSVSANTTLKAIAYESGMTDSNVVSAAYSIRAAAPSFSPAAGTYTGAQSVTISSATGGISIRYTTDGSTPSETAGTLYSGPVTVGSSQTLKAIAYAASYADSNVSSAGYTINLPQASAPTFSPGTGTYTSAQSVTISTATTGASIRYTTDGSTPSETAGTLYSGPVTIGSSETLKAIAYASGYTDSSVSSAGYTINNNGPVATPTFAPSSGAYPTAPSVTISTTTSGASIRYTTDGSTPTETTGTLYSGAISVSGATTLNAIAYETGYSDSAVASATYTVGANTFEAETQTIAATSGDTYTINTETGYSGGQGVQYNAAGVGDYITFRLPNIAAGTYDVVIGYKKITSRAIVQVSAGTAGGTLTNVGGTIDEYGSTSSYTSTDLGNWSATTSGSQDFKFTVTGHNASSTGYTVTIDYIKLTSQATTYTITASAGTGGAISPSGSVNVNQGANQTFTIGANSGYAISSVTVDGANVGAVSSYTFSNVQANHTISAAFSVISGGLPTGWTDVDVGAPAMAGSAGYSSGTFTVTGGGADIWGTADQFNYVYQSTSGDTTVTAEVATQSATNVWTKSGVMFRGSTAANDIFVDVFVTPSNGIAMQYRTAVGGTCTSIAGTTGAVAPYWVRIMRSGTTFTGYSSADGSTWTQVGSITLSMATSATAGLEVCAHTTTATNTSTFQNVAFTAPDSNIAPSGTAYGWFGMTSSTATTNQTAKAGLNDNNLTADVDLDSAGDAVSAWEAAGVIWSSAKTISSADFINGTITTGGDGFLTANLTLQYTTNGTTWTNTGWTIAPTYPYSSAAGGQTYTASGTALSGVLGMRFVGQVRSTDTSYHWIVKEVQFIGH